MRRRTALALLVCALAAALPACGSDEPTKSQSETNVVPPPSLDPEAEIADVVRSYFNALANGDAEKLCELLSDVAKGQFQAAAPEAGATCEEAAAGAVSATRKDTRQELLNTEVTDITVNGDSASASAVQGRRQVSLSRNDGKWQILAVAQTK
jgi:ketosteroid isomerase-like protein